MWLSQSATLVLQQWGTFVFIHSTKKNASIDAFSLYIAIVILAGTLTAK